MKQTNFPAIISLGSNLGNSLEILQYALYDIEKEAHIELIKYSSFYRTDPIGYLNQPDFINAACMIQTTLQPENLLIVLQSIENKYGRKRSFKNAPRTLDLDLIDFNHRIIKTSYLILPHPRAHQRNFVMTPFAEICPEYIFKNNLTALEWKKRLGSKGIQLLTFTSS